MSSTLSLHVGARHATPEQVDAIPLPPATATYGVIPHGAYRRMLLERMPEYGLQVDEERIGLGRDGRRMFGLLLLKGDKPDYQLALGYRNSYDRSMVAGLVVGSRVFVCDNLAFTGEKQMKIRHTVHAQERLERGVPDLLGSIRSVIEWQDRFIEGLKDRQLGEASQGNLIRECLRRRAVAPTRVQHAVLQVPDRSVSAWEFFNAFTHGMRELSADRVVLESKRLTALFARTFSLN